MNNRIYYKIGELKFEVLVDGEINKFGRVIVRIMPVSGSGEKWVNKDSLIFSAPRNKVVKK